MAQKQTDRIIVRTKMSEALLKACAESTGKATPKSTRKMVRYILTKDAAGTGRKFDSSRAKKKPADSAVEMKEAA